MKLHEVHPVSAKPSGALGMNFEDGVLPYRVYDPRIVIGVKCLMGSAEHRGRGTQLSWSISNPSWRICIPTFPSSPADSCALPFQSGHTIPYIKPSYVTVHVGFNHGVRSC